MITYTLSNYIASKKKLADRVYAIEELIDLMLLQSVEAIGTSGTAEYSLDDGQIKISTTYRNINEVNRGIETLESLKQMYLNRLRGRVTVLRDVRNFRR